MQAAKAGGISSDSEPEAGSADSEGVFARSQTEPELLVRTARAVSVSVQGLG